MEGVIESFHLLFPKEVIRYFAELSNHAEGACTQLPLLTVVITPVYAYTSVPL